MPVDIRNFFQKVPSSKKKDTTTAGKTASVTQKSKAPISSSSASSATTTAKAKRRQVVPAQEKAVPKKAAPKKAPATDEILIGSDTDEEEDKVVTKPTSRTNSKPSADSKATSPGKRKRVIIDSDDDGDDELLVVAPPPSSPPKKTSSSLAAKPAASPSKKLKSAEVVRSKASSPVKQSSPVKKASPLKRASPLKKAPPDKAPKKSLAPADTAAISSFTAAEAASECLSGLTFCVTAVDPDWSRDEATDYLKGLGARVTGAVSGRTDYLLALGEILEDDRPYTEGSKYKKATETGTRVMVGRAALHGVVKYHSDQQGGGVVQAPPASVPLAVPAVTSSVARAAPAAAAPKAVVKNPYARKISNPYARKSTGGEPKAASAATSNSYASQKPAATPSAPVQSSPSDANTLWVDKYKPVTTRDILGNAESVRKLTSWLSTWEANFNKDDKVGKAFSNPRGPWKAALLSGPPGIGKTTTATLVSRQSGRHVLEYNASDVRSKKSLQESVGDVTGSRTLTFGKQKGLPTKRCIIMDEVDGMGGGDRGGMAELIQMIKHSRVPIICICNDRQSQKLKSLVPYCLDLKYSRPRKSTIATRAVEIAQKEGLTVEQNAAELLAESCGNDVRQVLNCMQMWASANKVKSRMTYTDLKSREKSINKDEMLRVSLFDAARLILQGRQGLNGASPEAERAHFFRRNDAFFVDYNFTGLMVQQNYLKVLQGPFQRAKASNNSKEVEDILERTYKASESMSDFALVEHQLRSEQNWSILPFVGSLTVKTGYHAGGESGGMLPGFPEFSAWLGKNSSKGKKMRMLQELQQHMNFRISGGGEEVRLSYVPVLRERFVSLLQSKAEGSNEAAIELMDEYGLDRDDILEKLDEFKMDPKDKGFSTLDSKQKAAITRAYNAGSHKSQALVAEQGGAKKPKRKAAAVEESFDPDVIDDDRKNEPAEDEDDDEGFDPKVIAAMFKKKGRAKKTATKAGTSKAAAKRKKK